MPGNSHESLSGESDYLNVLYIARSKKKRRSRGGGVAPCTASLPHPPSIAAGNKDGFFDNIDQDPVSQM